MMALYEKDFLAQFILKPAAYEANTDLSKTQHEKQFTFELK